MPQRPRRRIPEATVARLPVYLRSLLELADSRITTVSSERLAEMAGVNAAKVRKDLSYLGSYGTRGVGYEVAYLVYQIRRELGLEHEWPVVIVGAGNLGQALAGYGGFNERGFPVAGIVDIDPAKVDTVVGGVRVRPLADLAQIVSSKTVSIGVAQLRLGESVDELLARTERILHVAKQFGRDRVEVASTPPSRVERAKVVGLYD